MILFFCLLKGFSKISICALVMNLIATKIVAEGGSMNRLIDKSIIAKNIRYLRLSSRKTQQTVSDEMHRDIRQIRRYETSGTSNIEVINEIAIYYQVDAIKLISSNLEEMQFKPEKSGFYYVVIGQNMSSRPIICF